MSILTQNPGISGLSELTTVEELFIQNLAGLTYATGDILYQASGGDLTNLAVGANGKVLKVTAGIPAWETVSGTGDLLADGTIPLTANWDVGAFELTALNVNVDGDTSAGDLATLGYTSVEGLIVTGQGSTYDVTVKNDADATVLGVETGTTIVRVGSELKFVERADHESTPGAGFGYLWVKSDTPSSLIYTDDAGTDVDLTAAATGDVSGDTASADKELVRFNGTGGKTIESPVTDNASVTATLSDNVDLTLYDATNDGNPVFSLGASSAERLTITPNYDSGAQTLEFVEFATAAASATADRGEFRFNVDGALSLTIDDGGIELPDAHAYFIDTSNVLSETTLGSTVVASSLTSLGTLTTLTVDDITINANAITSAGASSMTIVPTAGQSLILDGALDIDGAVMGYTGAFTVTGSAIIDGVTIDAATIVGTTAASLEITPTAGQSVILDGALDVDGAVMGYTGVFTTTGSIIVDTLTIDAASITDSSGSISFGDDNITTTGVITGVTLEATGDTAAGDNSAIGYTATEGIVITGQGSTSDVTIKNDADETILTIPTGSNDLKFGVDGTASNLILAEKASVQLDPAGGADGDYSGITFTATAGATVAFGDVVYLDSADSEWKLADADATGTAGAVAVAICVSAGTDGNPVTLMSHGIIRADAGFPALTIGAPVYISTTGTTTNTVTVTAPSGADDVVRVLGHAITANEMIFSPSPNHATVTG
jgi:hypothetical protein